MLDFPYIPFTIKVLRNPSRICQFEVNIIVLQNYFTILLLTVIQLVLLIKDQEDLNTLFGLVDWNEIQMRTRRERKDNRDERKEMIGCIFHILRFSGKKHTRV